MADIFYDTLAGAPKTVIVTGDNSLTIRSPVDIDLIRIQGGSSSPGNGLNLRPHLTLGGAQGIIRRVEIVVTGQHNDPIHIHDVSAAQFNSAWAAVLPRNLVIGDNGGYAISTGFSGHGDCIQATCGSNIVFKNLLLSPFDTNPTVGDPNNDLFSSATFLHWGTEVSYPTDIVVQNCNLAGGQTQTFYNTAPNNLSANIAPNYHRAQWTARVASSVRCGHLNCAIGRGQSGYRVLSGNAIDPLGGTGYVNCTDIADTDSRNWSEPALPGGGTSRTVTATAGVATAGVSAQIIKVTVVGVAAGAAAAVAASTIGGATQPTPSAADGLASVSVPVLITNVNPHINILVGA